MNILHFVLEIHFAIWTNIYCPLEKCILPFREIHLAKTATKDCDKARTSDKHTVCMASYLSVYLWSFEKKLLKIVSFQRYFRAIYNTIGFVDGPI